MCFNFDAAPLLGFIKIEQTAILGFSSNSKMLSTSFGMQIYVSMTPIPSIGRYWESSATSSVKMLSRGNWCSNLANLPEPLRLGRRYGSLARTSTENSKPYKQTVAITPSIIWRPRSPSPLGTLQNKGE